jgi:hypothetical protein
VAGLGDPVAADYAAYLGRQGHRRVVLVGAALDDGQGAAANHEQPAALVLFLSPRLKDRAGVDALTALALQRRPNLVCVISSFQVHLGNREAAEAEEYVLSRLGGLPVAVFRPGHILSPSSPAAARLQRFGFCSPLVPQRLRGCCVEGDELFAAIEAERAGPHPGRTYTLLGPNRPWQELLARHRRRGVGPFVLMVLCGLLALLLIGEIAALVLGLLARRRPALRALNFGTLCPRSLPELLALYNKYSHRHVKVVGYNNGVVHFGQKFPSKTIVSTVRCNRIAWAGPDHIEADCGATIHKAMQFLADSERELPVLPNYSYVALGTAFFVPIHGSASAFSTVADTIVKVVLYDPIADQTLTAARDEPAFREHLYDLKSPVLLLRLQLCVKPRSRYSVQREELDDPDSATLLAALQDSKAANVEVRKAQAAGTKVRLYRYYQAAGDARTPGLDLPRDRLGRLWDRLEENPITSFLMHALTRHIAWHVELFFTPGEFADFWATHRTLPLQKIQLRYIRRDGMPKSPFRDHDCVSSDMFMLRRHRRKFESYLARTFAVVRANPGKHSG